MLAMAAWMLARIVPDRAALLLFAVPAIAAARACCGAFPRRRLRALPRSGVWRRAARRCGGLYGAGAAARARRAAPTIRCIRWHAGRQTEQALAFRTIASVARSAARGAGRGGRPSGGDARHRRRLVHLLQGDAALHLHRSAGCARQLQSVRLLRANVTANNADDQALLHEFQIFGPPTIAFYDAAGPRAAAVPRRGLHEGRRVRRAAAPGAGERLARRARAPVIDPAATRAGDRCWSMGAGAGGGLSLLSAAVAAAARAGRARHRLPAPTNGGAAGHRSPKSGRRPRPRRCPTTLPDLTLPDLTGQPQLAARLRRPAR